MIMQFRVEIHQNGLQYGLRLEEFIRKLKGYLERKKRDEPIVCDDGARTYLLRNGLRATVFPLNGSFLEMRVEGEEQRFKKAVQAMRAIYSGQINVEYVTPI